MRSRKKPRRPRNVMHFIAVWIRQHFTVCCDRTQWKSWRSLLLFGFAIEVRRIRWVLQFWLSQEQWSA